MRYTQVRISEDSVIVGRYDGGMYVELQFVGNLGKSTPDAEIISVHNYYTGEDDARLDYTNGLTAIVHEWIAENRPLRPDFMAEYITNRPLRLKAVSHV